MARYFESRFAEQLYKIRDSFKSTKAFSANQELTLYKIFQSADADLSYGMLERTNRKKDEFYKIFNENVSAETQEKIRLFLLKQYINEIVDHKRASLLSGKIAKSGTKDPEIKFLLFNGANSLEVGILVELLEARVFELGIASMVASAVVAITDRITGPENRGVKKEISDAQRGLAISATKIKAVKPKTVTAASEDKVASIGDTSAFKMNAEDRKALEELVLLINELNHCEFVGALLQFRIDGLEKRIVSLEKQNQTSLLGFFANMLLTFVVPFGIGKIGEAAIKRLASHAQHASVKSWDFPKLKDTMAKIKLDQTPGVKAISLWFNDPKPHLEKFNSLYRKIPTAITDHWDDYAQFTADAIVKIYEYRTRNNPTIPKFNSLAEFMQFSIGHSRSEIINLESSISSFPDGQLITESIKCLSLDFAFYHNGMKDELEQYEAEQKRVIQERKERLDSSPSLLMFGVK